MKASAGLKPQNQQRVRYTDLVTLIQGRYSFDTIVSLVGSLLGGDMTL
jgi:hypothetical protein